MISPLLTLRALSARHCSGHLILLILLLLCVSYPTIPRPRSPCVIKSKFCSAVTLIWILFVQLSLRPVCVAITHGFVLLPSPTAGIRPLEYGIGILIGEYPNSEPQKSMSPIPGLLRRPNDPATPTFRIVELVTFISVFSR